MRINKLLIATRLMAAGGLLILISFIISILNIIHVLIKTDTIPHITIKIFFIGLGLITIGLLIGGDWIRNYTNSKKDFYPNDSKDIHDIREIDT